MLNRVLHILPTSAFLFLISLGTCLAQGTYFTREQMEEDLLFLTRKLQARHPNLQIYTGASEFASFVDQMVFPDSVNEQTAYTCFASLSSVIKDGHTFFYPSMESIDERDENDSFLPIQLYWDGKHAYLTKDFGFNPELKPGRKITSIGGELIDSIIHHMLPRMMRDGNSLKYPTWILNTFFFEYYSYFYGFSSTYSFGIEDETGKAIKVIARSVKKEELMPQLFEEEETLKRGIYLDLDSTTHTAILTIKDWHNEALKERYKQHFKKEIHPIFEQILSSGVEHLIIDIRDNQGGNTINAKRVLAYLLDEPFVMIEGFNKLKNGELRKASGSNDGVQKPEKNVFGGKLVVLINGGSFSNSGIFASTLRKYERAVFVGEETGGSACTLSANALLFTLPNTGVRVAIPILQFVLKDCAPSEFRGVRPDHEIKASIEDLIEF